MKWTREEWDKNDGIQAHHVIQSFSPEDNLTARQANDIGRQLAEEIAKGHEAAVYTHTDRDHIHNHIVINAVSFEDGHKYHSDKEQLYKIREASDKLCLEHNLSIVKEPNAKERFTMAEYKLVERGEPLWKDELRTSIEEAKQKTRSLDEMKQYLHDRYGIEMKIQNRNVSFLHPEKQKFCRGKTLGADFSKETIQKVQSQSKERLPQQQSTQQDKSASKPVQSAEKTKTPTNHKTPSIFQNIDHSDPVRALRNLGQGAEKTGRGKQQSRDARQRKPKSRKAQQQHKGPER